MILELSDWLFLVNHELAKAAYQEEVANHCNCPFCRNFYRAVDGTYPDLRYFLSRFSVNIEAPESLVPMSATLYQASYLAQGKILRFGSEPLFINDVAVDFEDSTEPECFYINLGLMEFPWVIEDDMQTAASSAAIQDYFSSFRKK